MAKKKPTLTEVPPEAPATDEAPLTLAAPGIVIGAPASRTSTAELPTMGRMVRYRDERGHEAPAVVSGVNEDETLALHVFYRTGVEGKHDIDSVRESSGGEGWSWPQRT